MSFLILTISGDWKLGEKAEDCNNVCKTIGKDCDPLKASKLSEGEMAEMISTFNQTCDKMIECGSAATPSLNPNNNECCTGKPGVKPDCNKKQNQKRQLCYCASKKGKFI